MSTVDIIIPVYFAPELTIRCVESVVRTMKGKAYDSKVILVDDSESEDFHTIIKNVLHQKGLLDLIEIIKHERNSGFIEACYTGIETRNSDYKVLLNSDTIVVGDWLEQMILTAESDDKIALVNPVTNTIPVINVAMPEGFNINLMNSNFASSDYSNTDAIDIVTAAGFCLLLKSKYIEEFGFFDRIYGKGYGEESDLHFRYTNNGLRSVISPKAFVYHRGEASFSDRDERVKNNREIFLSRYRDSYLNDYEKFLQNTILHKLRSDLNSSLPLNYDVIFLVEDNDMLNPSYFFTNHIVNILNEKGLSSIVALDHKHDRSEQIEDRLYNPISIDHLHGKEFSSRLIVAVPSMLSKAIKTQFLNKSKCQLLILDNCENNFSFASDIESLLKELGIKRISSVRNTEFTMPFMGGLEYIGILLKSKNKLNSHHNITHSKNSRQIIIFDNENELQKCQVEVTKNTILIYTGKESDLKHKKNKYIHSSSLCETDILKMFSQNDFLIDVRCNLFFSELHLNFILAGGVVVSDTLIVPDSINLDVSERLILLSQLGENLPTSMNTESMLKLCSRTKLESIELPGNSGSEQLRENVYKKTIELYFKLENAVIKDQVVYQITISPDTVILSNRLRYRIVDRIINTLIRIPLTYDALRLSVKGARYVKKQIVQTS
ncbi:MAG: glycosyltransferase family 2 protein [Candidatus Dojkabacteria bacterium]